VASSGLPIHKVSGNKLLSLIIAFECLLPSRPSGSIWISEGVALLLGPNPTERRGIRNRIHDLYRKRNGIMHGGKREEITRDDVVWARKQVHTIVRTIINRRDEFENQDGTYCIATWLEDRKLAAGP
jgi:hypothetical protein